MVMVVVVVAAAVVVVVVVVQKILKREVGRRDLKRNPPEGR